MNLSLYENFLIKFFIKLKLKIIIIIIIINEKQTNERGFSLGGGVRLTHPNPNPI